MKGKRLLVWSLITINEQWVQNDWRNYQIKNKVKSNNNVQLKINFFLYF